MYVGNNNNIIVANQRMSFVSSPIYSPWATCQETDTETFFVYPCRDLGCKKMSTMLNLNCWVLGDDPRLVLPIKIAKSETVGGLKIQSRTETLLSTISVSGR